MTLEPAPVLPLAAVDATRLGEISAAVLSELCDLLGDEGSDGFFQQVADDLNAAIAGARRAAEVCDHSGLRAHTHVLVGVAGAIGAAPLEARARQLNAAAHAADSRQIARLLPEVSCGVDSVCARLAETRAEGPQGA